jgi:hypothetical protein
LGAFLDGCLGVTTGVVDFRAANDEAHMRIG